MENLRGRLSALIEPLESARGYAIWLNAPVALTDAVQSALDAVNEAVGIADKEIERKNQGEFAMRELCEMLAKYQAVRESIKATSERLDRVQEVCVKCNAGLDQFFADAEQICVPGEEPEEAAPNGELSDGGAAIEGAI